MHSADRFEYESGNESPYNYALNLLVNVHLILFFFRMPSEETNKRIRSEKNSSTHTEIHESDFHSHRYFGK